MNGERLITSRGGEMRAAFFHGLLLLLLLAFVFPGVFLRGEMISPSDMLGAIPPWRGHVELNDNVASRRLMSDVVAAFHPYYALVRASLDRGEWPLWNHLEYGGMPLLANCQSTVFYPPRLLHAFLDVRVATTLYILLKLWLCGMMAFVCARGIRMRRDTARFLSVGWMLASYNLIWANWSLTDVAAWAPLLFLGVELLLDGRYRRGFFAMAAGGSLIFLAGHPETALTTCLGLGLYFAMRLGLERRRGRRLWAPLGIAAGAAGVSALVCMPVILPFAEYLVNSDTFYNRSEHAMYPMNAGAVTSFWLPRFYGAFVDENFWGDSNSNLLSMLYAGIAVWAGIALLAVKRQTRDRRTQALFAVTVLLLLLAFNMPGLNAVTKLPVLKSNRTCYYATFALFALPLLGALGLERFMAERGRLRELKWPLLLGVVAGLVIGFEYWFAGTLIRTMGMEQYIQRQIIVAALAAAAVIGILAGYCLYARRAVWMGVLTVVLAVDLIYANRGLNPTMPLEDVFPEMPLTQYLRSLGDHRFGFPEGNIPSGLMAPYGLEDWQGYDGLYPARATYFYEEVGPALWGKFEPLRSIGYYLNDPDYPPVIPAENLELMERVEKLDGLEVLKNKDALPRAYLVPRVETVRNARELVAKLRDPEFEPRETLLTEQPPSGPLPAAGKAAAELGRADVAYRGGTRVVVEVEAVEDCALVLSDAFYPGWKASVDGTPAEIFPAYYVYRGVIVPAGRHEVVFAYMPRTFVAGMAISVGTLMAMLAAAIWCGRSRTFASP